MNDVLLAVFTASLLRRSFRVHAFVRRDPHVLNFRR
jgi:hypothetical protein